MRRTFMATTLLLGTSALVVACSKSESSGTAGAGVSASVAVLTCRG
jgi:hypothetical protein